MTLGWALLIALAAGFAGGLGAGSVGGWVRSGLARLRGRTEIIPPTGDHLPSGQDAVTQLDITNIRSDLGRLQGAIEQVHSEVSTLAERLAKPFDNRPPSPAPPPDRPRYAPPVQPDDPWRAANPPRAPEFASDAPPSVAALESAPAAAVPPMNAINVEARDDRIVASPRHPPEAWLELRGPASGQLTLNPTGVLNEYSLRRLSTFFDWTAERPGATYETVSPAHIQWDEGQKTGTLVKRGTARPR